MDSLMIRFLIPLVHPYVSQERQSEKRIPLSIWIPPSTPIHFYLPITSKTIKSFRTTLAYIRDQMTKLSYASILLLPILIYIRHHSRSQNSPSSSHNTLPTHRFQIIDPYHLCSTTIYYTHTSTTYSLLQYYTADYF